MPKGQKPYVPNSRKLKAISRELLERDLVKPNPAAPIKGWQGKALGEALKTLSEAGMLTTASVQRRHDRDTRTQRFKSRKV